MSSTTTENVVEELERPVKRWANGAHVIAPKRWAGRKVKILLLAEPSAPAAHDAPPDALDRLIGCHPGLRYHWKDLEEKTDEELMRLAGSRD